jgi:hypothetical protein
MGPTGNVAGEVLGPQPGRAIITFCGGRIEILLRIIATLFGSLPALIGAAVALSTLESIDDNVESLGISGDIIFLSGSGANTSSGEGMPVDIRVGSNTDFEDLRDDTNAATGVVIAVTSLAIIIEFLAIILRFLNFGIINLRIKCFLGIDIVLSFLLAGGHFAGGVLQAVTGGDWDDLTPTGDNVITPFGTFSEDDRDTIYQSIVASAVFCFLGMCLFLLLALFMICYVRNDWNSKVVKATLKGATHR